MPQYLNKVLNDCKEREKEKQNASLIGYFNLFELKIDYRVYNVKFEKQPNK